MNEYNMNPSNPYVQAPSQAQIPNQGSPYASAGYNGMSQSMLPPGYRSVDKALYVVLAFFLGTLGVHRFLRGQVAVGIVMLLFSWMTLGIWPLVDFIIGLVKLGEYPGSQFVFDPNGNWATA